MAQEMTAVEWLLKFIEPSLTPEQKQFFSIVIPQSKKMNEQQTVDAYKHGQNNGYNYRSNGTNYITGEQYYNETYTQSGTQQD